MHDKADEALKKEREDLKKFLETRSGKDADGQEFIKQLEDSKTKLGPYSMKIAEEFI